MKGWCPVDDRIVEARRDGTCPDCGTALLEVPASAKPTRGAWVPSDVEEAAADVDQTVAAPPSRSRRTIVVSAAALVVVFAGGALAGAVFTSGRKPSAPPASARVHEVQNEWGPFPAVTQDGVTLRLLSVRQDGRQVGLTFDPIGGRNVDDIRNLSLQVVAGATEAVTGNEVKGPYIDVQATLANPSVAVSRVTVSQFEVRRPGTGPWTLPLPRSLRVTSSNAPHVERVETVRRTIDGPVMLTALIAWRDRIEIHFDVSRLQAALGSVFVGNVVVIGHGRDGGGEFAIEPLASGEQVDGDYSVVLDSAILADHSEISVQITGLLEQLNGDWSWTVPPPRRGT